MTQRKWEIRNESRVFDGFLKIEQAIIRTENRAGQWREPNPRERVVRPDASGVLLLNHAGDRVVLVRQFRYAATGSSNPWLLEIVAGVVDQGETPQECAHREVQEEIGCGMTLCLPIAVTYASPGYSTERLHLFVGRADGAISQKVGGLASEEEFLEIEQLPLEDALAWLERGEVDDAKTLIGMQWLAMHRDRIPN